MTLAPPAPYSSLDHLGETTTLAVSYLRVSTKEQAERGGRDEGFSIPAQRDANLRKARDLNAIVIEEFVDAGKSARKADRPELMPMIEYVKTHSVAYSIVHKVDRLARNRADDVAIHLALKEPASCSSPRPRTSTRPRAGCCCTASCPRSRSSTPVTSPTRSPRA